jgi:hypothetical protein
VTHFHSVRADLVQAARELREIVDADTFPQVTMDKQKVRRLRDLLHRAERAFETADAEADRQQRRIGTLESANGSLMVDRDRTASRAAEQVAAARDLVVKHLGIDHPEVDQRMREQAEYAARTLQLLDRDREAYDLFRTTIVCLMGEVSGIEQPTPEQWRAVKDIVAKANKKALGR